LRPWAELGVGAHPPEDSPEVGGTWHLHRSTWHLHRTAAPAPQQHLHRTCTCTSCSSSGSTSPAAGPGGPDPELASGHAGSYDPFLPGVGY
ncbi:MAG: hypothetical protein JXR96_10205, partial [Deltaproteobacteria bacterium]|nr:hypothetical protein [Deltaproteobacteria bacterium]